MAVRTPEQRNGARRGFPSGTVFASDGRRDALLFLFLFACVAVGAGRAWQPLGDWDYFVPAGRQLLTARWRYVYIDNPDAQSGPLMLIMVHVLDALNAAYARLAIMSCCLMSLALLTLDTRTLRNVRARLAFGGFMLALWWPRISAFGHLDDAVVLLLATCAVVLARRDRRWLVAVIAGLAIGVKPTAVFMLAFAVPRHEWRRLANWAPMALAAAIGGLIWSPFVLASMKTLETMKPRVGFMDDSVPGFFGLDGRFPPAAYRAAQLVLVMAAAVYVARKHGPTAVMLAGTASRMLLDPAAWQYYTPGMVLGALVWEAYESEDTVPWLTIGSALFLTPRWAITAPNVRAGLRFVACTAAVGLVLRGVPPSRAGRRSAQGDGGGQVAGEVAGHPVAGP